MELCPYFWEVPMKKKWQYIYYVDSASLNTWYIVCEQQTYLNPIRGEIYKHLLYYLVICPIKEETYEHLV